MYPSNTTDFLFATLPVLDTRAPLPPSSLTVRLQSSSFLYTGGYPSDAGSSSKYSRSRWKLGAVGRCAETGANAATFRELSKLTLPDLHNTVSSIGVIMGKMDQDGNMHVRLQVDDDMQIADY